MIRVLEKSGNLAAKPTIFSPSQKHRNFPTSRDFVQRILRRNHKKKKAKNWWPGSLTFVKSLIFPGLKSACSKDIKYYRENDSWKIYT